MLKLYQTERIELRKFVDVKKTVMEICSKDLISPNENEKLINVVDLLLKKFRRIPITDRAGNLKGIITTSDILDILGGGEKHKMFIRYRRNISTPIKNFMIRHVRTVDAKTSVEKVLAIFKSEDIGAYPITHRKKLVGIISEWDFVKLINKPTGLSVEDLMVRKPMIIKKDYTVHDVTKIICRGGFRRLPVVDNNILLGMVTSKDILIYLHRKPNLTKLETEMVKISRIMNRKIITVKPKTEIFDAVKIMREKGIGGLPVTEGDLLIGILTERDILEAFS